MHWVSTTGEDGVCVRHVLGDDHGARLMAGSQARGRSGRTSGRVGSAQAASAVAAGRPSGRPAWAKNAPKISIIWLNRL